MYVNPLCQDSSLNGLHSFTTTIQWRSRKSVAKTMPLEFRKDFSRCICIIDCFEVFCEPPSDLMAPAPTFSNYKHHNTVKLLIAITPQGVVSYVSKDGVAECLINT